MTCIYNCTSQFGKTFVKNKLSSGSLYFLNSYDEPYKQRNLDILSQSSSFGRESPSSIRVRPVLSQFKSRVQFLPPSELETTVFSRRWALLQLEKPLSHCVCQSLEEERDYFSWKQGWNPSCEIRHERFWLRWSKFWVWFLACQKQICRLLNEKQEDKFFFGISTEQQWSTEKEEEEFAEDEFYRD